jgi:ElaB/YqjD/DUF883 family membrane-anchored ribosome-binding protein
MDNETEMIKHQMEETRSSLTEKLETLEQQVVNTVQGTTHAVTDTVETVKEAVEGTVEKVKETVEGTVEAVKNTFNLSLQVERHPWIMIGGSVAAGFVLGRLLPSFHADGSAAPAAASPEPLASRAPSYAAPAPASHRGLFHGLGETIGAELNKLKGLAIGTLFGMAREMIAKAVHGELGNRLTGVIDRITGKLGGEVLPESTLEGLAGKGEEHHERGPTFR